MADRLTPPTGTLDLRKSYTARFKTERGEFTCELFAADAPLTVENFINLARSGYYDGTTFHRVIPGFMAQGGDPTGTGSGGPGYTFGDEFSAARRHDGPGVLSMANAGPRTNGSQFFITYAATPHLDGKHSVFGRVSSGMEVVRQIRERDPGRDREPGDRIESIAIEES
jgi:cyclophilin family peptidyl-prolyl cis-trans isomerase